MAILAPAAMRAQSVLSTILGGALNGAPASSATLNIPSAVTADKQGNVYAAIKGSHQIVKIDSSGVVWLVAGTGAGGSSGDGGPAKSATFWTPAALAMDSSGNMYIADSSANRIRRIASDGTISTFAGNGYAGSSGDGGAATDAMLNNPTALAVDLSGNLLIADTGNNTIRIVTSDGKINKLAGNGVKGSSASGSPALSAHFSAPQGVAVDSSSGKIYIADTGNNWIYSLPASGGNLTLYAGLTGTSSGGGFGGGTTLDPTVALDVSLATPTNMVVDSKGNLYFVEYGSPRVRQVTPAGKISSYAGTGTAGTSGDGGLARSATLNVIGIGIDSKDDLLIADGVTDKVRIVTPSDLIINSLAGTGVGSITSYGIFLSGNYLYYCDSASNSIRRFNLTNGQIDLVAGTGANGYSGDSVLATTAPLNNPHGVALDQSGNVYIADTGNNRVRKVNATTGYISTIAGTGVGTTTGDGYLATSATVHEPSAVVVDSSGNVYFAERAGHVIRKINTSGMISTIAGMMSSTTGVGSSGYPDSETGVATAQRLSYPQGLTFDSSGALIISDTNNNRVRRLTSDGIITTLAGGNSTGYSGDGGSAMSATLRNPTGAFLDSYGNLYISDTGNSVVRRVSPDGVINTVAGTGTGGFIGDGSPATAFQLNAPTAVIAASSSCNALIADTQNGRVRQLAAPIDYVITTSPAGLNVVVDGQAVTTPATVQLLPGTHHVIDAPATQAGTSGTQYISTGSQSVDPVCGAGRVALTMKFTTQYSVTIATDHGGTVSPGAGWANAGSTVALTATAATGYSFGGWEGDCKGTGACSLVMTGPKSVKADFSPTQNTKATVSSGGVVGAGLSVPSVTALSPNGIAIAFGTNFAPAGTLSVVSSTTLVNGKVSTEMDGVCVLVGSTPAPILAVTPTQVNFQVPEGVAAGTTTVQVVTGCGTTNELKSTAVTVSVQTAAPEFFYFLQNSTGVNPIAAVDATTGVYVGDVGLISGGTFAPAKPGDILTLYATGLGLTTPASAAGELPTAAETVAGQFQISVGGAAVAASDVLYAGVTPGIAGLYQINIRLSSSLADGNQAVRMTVNGYSSPVGPFVTVKR